VNLKTIGAKAIANVGFAVTNGCEESMNLVPKQVITRVLVCTMIRCQVVSPTWFLVVTILDVRSFLRVFVPYFGLLIGPSFGGHG
jgi:hypothetical protein